MLFRERIEEAMQAHGYRKAADVAKAMGHKRAEGFNRLMRDDDAKPSYEMLNDLAVAFPKTNMRWLITGKGEKTNELASDIDKHTGNNIKESPATYNTPQKPAVGIPLVNFEAIAGLGNANFSIDKVNIQDRYIVPDFEHIDFMIKVRNNSMYPRYTSGDVVACRIIKSDSFIQWNRAHIVGAGDQGLLLKRIMPGNTDNTVQLISDNKDYPPITINRKDIHGLALVVGTIRLE